jgi:hypothetical protein
MNSITPDAFLRVRYRHHPARHLVTATLVALIAGVLVLGFSEPMYSFFAGASFVLLVPVLGMWISELLDRRRTAQNAVWFVTACGGNLGDLHALSDSSSYFTSSNSRHQLSTALSVMQNPHQLLGMMRNGAWPQIRRLLHVADAAIAAEPLRAPAVHAALETAILTTADSFTAFPDPDATPLAGIAVLADACGIPTGEFAGTGVS